MFLCIKNTHMGWSNIRTQINCMNYGVVKCLWHVEDLNLLNVTNVYHKNVQCFVTKVMLRLFWLCANLRNRYLKHCTWRIFAGLDYWGLHITNLKIQSHLVLHLSDLKLVIGFFILLKSKSTPHLLTDWSPGYVVFLII